MPKLPQAKPKDVIRILKKAGYALDHVTGSHHIFYKSDGAVPISVPFHNKPLKKGTFAGIIKQSGLTTREFLDLL